MVRQMIYFLVMVIFIGCGGGSNSSSPTTNAPSIADKGNVELVNGESAIIRFTSSGSPITSCTVTPTLPSGLSLDADCTIRGIPTTDQAFTTYTVEGSNSAGSDNAQVDIKIISHTATNVVLSGTVTYDFVPFGNGLNSGLDYNNMSHKKVRGVVVDIVDASGVIIGTTHTDSNGFYSVSVTGTSAKVRVSAQLLQAVSAGNSSWNFQVKDNTNSNALYVIEGSLASLGTSGTQTRNLNAPSGWDGTSYSSTRVAAPFAILDVVYEAIQMVKGAQNDAVFAPLNIFWSKHNIAASGNTSLGQIITSHFEATGLYILGAENSDTDEYDRAIIAHEWGHYYEANFSRADSRGGGHGGGDILDIRLAFGEGFGTAIGCMINGSPLYQDSSGISQHTTGVFANLENGGSRRNPGWYSEASIYSILYDIYDNHDDAGDTLSLGFAPMHRVLIGAQKNTNAFTSIFSFITALKAENPGYEAEIDAITANESIAAITDIYGTGRTNRVLENANPLYAELPVGGSVDIVTNYSASATYATSALGIFNFVKFLLHLLDMSLKRLKPFHSLQFHFLSCENHVLHHRKQHIQQ